MPKWGIEMTEGTLAEWNIREGERVTRGQVIAQIETDKIVNEVQAESEVTFVRLLATPGEVYPVGALLAVTANEAAPKAAIDEFVRTFRGPDGQPVEDPNAFEYRFATKMLGGTARLTFMRSGKETFTDVALETPPAAVHDELVIAAQYGLPKPFSKAPRLTVYKRELYDCAECINLCLLLRNNFPQVEATLKTVIESILKDWTKSDGSFRSRRLHIGWDNVPMHRWGQSQMFRSLAFYLCELSKTGTSKADTLKVGALTAEGLISNF